jgi:hypothetical protein
MASIPPCIPGLLSICFTKGSRHSADAPALEKSTVAADGSVDFTWVSKSRGLYCYTITAKGKLACSDDDDDSGKPSYTGLNVACSCPDGERQKAASLESGNIIVCKHGAAALQSVIDKDAVATLKREAKRRAKLRRTEFDVRKARQKEEEEAQRQAQETECQAQEAEMPGERARLEYGIDALGSEQVIELIKKCMGTVEGLRTVATLFPESIMPIPNTKYCVRCKKTYDDRFLSQRLCQIPHPEDECIAHRDKYRSWNQCEQCEKTFDVTGEYLFGSKYCIMDKGKWCFEGEHVSDDMVL